MNNPVNDKKVRVRVFRGGCWGNFVVNMPMSYRFQRFLGSQIDILGFRIVRNK